PREITDQAVGRSELTVRGHPGTEVVRFEVLGAFEQVDRVGAVLDRLLERAQARRDRRGRVTGARRADRIALLLGLGRHLLVVGQGLATLAPVDRGECREAIERVLARGEGRLFFLLLRRVAALALTLALTLLPLPSAATSGSTLRLDQRGDRDAQH